MVDPNGFVEVTCKMRERCAYFDIYFYRHHRDHLDEFEEMFPFVPCKFFVEKVSSETKHTERDVVVDFLCGIDDGSDKDC